MTREMVVDHHIVMVVVVVIMAVIVMVVEETGDRRRPMIGEVAERVTMMIDMIDITMMPMIGLQSQRQHHPHHRHRQRTHQTVIEGEEVVEEEVVVVVVAVVVVDQRVVDPIEIVSIHGARPLREMITEGRMTEGRLSVAAVAVVVVVEEREVTVWIRERRIDRREALIRETSHRPPVEVVVEEMTLDQNLRPLVVVVAVDVAPPHRHPPPPRSDPLLQEMMVEDVVAVVVAEVTTRAIDIDQVNVTVRDNEDECDNINSKKTPATTIHNSCRIKSRHFIELFDFSRCFCSDIQNPLKSIFFNQ